MANPYSHPGVSNHDLRRVAVAAVCDPRTVVRYLRGESMTVMTKTRIEQAFHACALDALLSLRPTPARRDSTPPPPRSG